MSSLSRNYPAISRASRKGGLRQVVSKAGGSKTEGAFFTALRTSTDEDYFLWIADGGELYAEALLHDWTLPLSRLLQVKARDAPEAWRVALEATQTSLFRFVFLRVSIPCAVAQLRKFQLVAEKNRCDVFLLTPAPLPHWTLRETIEVGPHADPLRPQSPAAPSFRGKLLFDHAESVSVQPR